MMLAHAPRTRPTEARRSTRPCMPTTSLTRVTSSAMAWLCPTTVLNTRAMRPITPSSISRRTAKSPSATASSATSSWYSCSSSGRPLRSSPLLRRGGARHRAPRLRCARIASAVRHPRLAQLPIPGPSAFVCPLRAPGGPQHERRSPRPLRSPAPPSRLGGSRLPSAELAIDVRRRTRPQPDRLLTATGAGPLASGFPDAGKSR